MECRTDLKIHQLPIVFRCHLERGLELWLEYKEYLIICTDRTIINLKNSYTVFPRLDRECTIFFPRVLLLRVIYEGAYRSRASAIISA